MTIDLTGEADERPQLSKDPLTLDQAKRALAVLQVRGGSGLRCGVPARRAALRRAGAAGCAAACRRGGLHCGVPARRAALRRAGAAHRVPLAHARCAME
jgi:hypothetical protein